MTSQDDTHADLSLRPRERSQYQKQTLDTQERIRQGLVASHLPFLRRAVEVATGAKGQTVVHEGHGCVLASSYYRSTY